MKADFARESALKAVLGGNPLVLSGSLASRRLRENGKYVGGEADLYGFALQEEKEVIAIVAMRESRNVILETIHKIHGPQTEAGAVVCSVALEQMVRLG